MNRSMRSYCTSCVGCSTKGDTSCDSKKGVTHKHPSPYNQTYVRELRGQIKNCMAELYFQTSAYLTKHYDAVLLPIFQTKDMVKESNTRNYRFNEGMLSLNNIRFRQLLQTKCAVSEKRLVFYSEMYMSQTCALCNRLHLKPGSKDVFDWAAWWYIFAGHFVIVAPLTWNAAVNANERDREVNKKLYTQLQQISLQHPHAADVHGRWGVGSAAATRD